MNTLCFRFYPWLLAVIITVGLTACSQQQEAKEEGTTPTTPPVEKAATFEEAMLFLKTAAEQDRSHYKALTFEAFKARVYKEPFTDGKYIVNGDTPIVDEKHLREFFENRVKKKPQSVANELIVHQVGGLDAVWNRENKSELTYCVSENFGSQYDRVVTEMEAATSVWERVTDINFTHVTAEDGRCDANNSNVLFDVRPVNVNGNYLARAFFPNESRRFRNVLIDKTSFQLSPGGNLTLTGVLRHELGHTLGFRHEHTRPGSGACFEDSDWRPVTEYDPFSVMHYPQCNGLGNWTLTLTPRDESGAACLYGAAAGFTIDTSICTPEVEPTPPPTASPQTQTFGPDNVAMSEEKRYGPFTVVPGTLFEANMHDGTGDPDIYVRFGAEPERFRYDCRPYRLGATETCALDVPADQSMAFIMVYGFSAGQYQLKVTHTPPAN